MGVVHGEALFAAVLLTGAIAGCRNAPRGVRSDTVPAVHERSELAMRRADTSNYGAERRRNIFAGLVAVHGSEMAVARVALDYATDTGVRRFARRLIKEHSTLEARLVTFAGTVAIERGPVGDAINASGREVVSRLQGKQSEAFDAAFVDAIIHFHEQALQFLLWASMAGAAVELDSAVSQVRQYQASHLDDAWQLKKALMGPP